MIQREESITLEWLDSIHEILSRAEGLLSLQTIDILMSLAEMNLANQADLTNIKIGEMINLVAMARETVCNKQQSAKVLTFTSRAAKKTGTGFSQNDQEIQDQTEAIILPFRSKVGRHYFTRN
jgi:hypothetical protein